MKSDSRILRYQTNLEVCSLAITTCLCCTKEEHTFCCFLDIYRRKPYLESPFGIVPFPNPFNFDENDGRPFRISHV